MCMGRFFDGGHCGQLWRQPPQCLALYRCFAGQQRIVEFDKSPFNEPNLVKGFFIDGVVVKQLVKAAIVYGIF